MRALRNPIGLPASRAPAEPPTLVQVGEEGELTHIFDPSLQLRSGDRLLPPGAPLCGSGYRSPNGKTGERNEPAIYRSSANYVTCVRCQKIAKMNLKTYGQFLRVTR